MDKDKLWIKTTANKGDNFDNVEMEVYFDLRAMSSTSLSEVLQTVTKLFHLRKYIFCEKIVI